MVPDVSRAVLKVMEGVNMTKFEKELYGDGSCSDQNGSTVTSSSLRFSSFWGLFLITGIASFSALFLYVVFFLHEHRDLLRTHDTNNSVSRRFASLAKAYDQKDPSHARKKPESIEMPAVGDITASPYSVSGPSSPYSISNLAEESFEIEEEVGTLPDEEGTPGREISSQNPGPPSFAEMLTERTSGRSG